MAKSTKVSDEVLRLAAAAYDHASELDHPVPDGVMREHTRRWLIERCRELSTDDREMLAKLQRHA